MTNVVIVAIVVAVIAAALFRLGLVINTKLKVIHTLVNSNLSNAIQAEHDGLIRELAGLQELVSLKQAAGHEPSEETLAVIIATQERIKVLTTQLHDRERTDALADKMAS